MMPVWSFSLTRWQSISKCLVRSWKTGLAAIWMALWLSQNNTGSLEHWMWRSLRRYRSHWSSQVAEARARYSASEDDLEIVICFFVLQEIRECPIKKHWPKMERLLSTQPAQSASENPCRWREEFLGKNKPLPGQLLRYLSTLKAALWWVYVGLERNWLNSCVMKVIYGLVELR